MTINPIPTDLTHPFSASIRAAQAAQAAQAARPSAPTAPVGDSVTRGAVPSSPPAAVFAAMLTAAQAADRLTAAGRTLHFSTDETTGLSVQLTDLDGTVLGTVAPSTVIDVASGATLD
jgi:hypothetical protein